MVSSRLPFSWGFQKANIKSVLLALLIWAAIIGGSVVWNIDQCYQSKRNLAIAEARSNWSKDNAFRTWATRHGGLYVKPDARTPPNPYLSHLPHRDVVTEQGMKLTLMNPAYMIRQMSQEFDNVYGIKGKITSRTLLNPINRADDWELTSLAKFDNGVTEIVEQSNINGAPYIRLMKPMIMKKECESCHGHLGFKEGDIRGGVSVSVPLAPYWTEAVNTVQLIYITHFIIWLIGGGFVVIFWGLIKNRESQLKVANNELLENRELLELRIEERTHELLNKDKLLLESQALAHQASKMAALGEMASGIAHEINSPLQTITLLNYRIRKGFEKSDSNIVFQSSDKLDDMVSSIAKIIESLKNLSRGCNNEAFVWVSVNQIMEDVFSISKERFLLKSISLKVNYTDNCQDTKLHCQRMQVGLIIINLLNNAYDVVLEPRDRWIDICISADNEYVEIKVINGGPKIDDSVKDKIFQPLFTTKEVGKGTGLGLSLSLGTAIAHGGSLHLADSHKNTCFILQLPISNIKSKEDV